MAGLSLSDTLTVIIGGSAAGFVSEITKASAATQNFISLEGQQSIASAKAQADADKAAKSVAAQALVASGGTSKDGSAEALALADATNQARLSKAALAVTTDTVTAAASKEAAANVGVTSGLGSLGNATNGVKTALSGIAAVAPAAVAALGVDLVAKGVSAYTSLGAQVLQVQQVIGGSAQDASVFVAQLNSLGISSNAVDKSINTLAVSIADGKSKLSDYGIEVAKNVDGSVNLYQTLNNIRAAYQATSDATERDTIANELKVRGLQNLVPLLSETNDQQKQIIATAQQSGNILNDSQVTQAKQLGIAMNEAGLAVKGLEVNLAEGLAPALTSGLKVLADLTSGLKDNRAEQAAFAAVVTAIVVPALLKLTASLAGPLIGAFDTVAAGLVTLGTKAAIGGRASRCRPGRRVDSGSRGCLRRVDGCVVYCCGVGGYGVGDVCCRR